MVSYGPAEAIAAAEKIREKVKVRGWENVEIRDGVVLGSGLGSFVENEMEDGSLRIPFSELDGEERGERVPGHAQTIVIGRLKKDQDGPLVLAQKGREHVYEGVHPRRATFWIRVMQVLGVKTLIGSNASGIITPDTLDKIPALMLVHSDVDMANDNPLKGQNPPEFGPRFPHTGDLYPLATRELIRKVAARTGVDLKEGTYVRFGTEPCYESEVDVFRARDILRGIWREGKKEYLRRSRYLDAIGKSSMEKYADAKYRDQKFLVGEEGATGVFGMSSTFEARVAQQASQAGQFSHRAFEGGRAYISVSTNYAAGLGPNGFETHPDHKEVEKAAQRVGEIFPPLVRDIILELRRPSLSAEQAGPQ